MCTKDWNQEARRLLQVELARKALSYRRLAILLEKNVGVATTERSLATKISRGTFSFAFFVQCMRAMGVNTVDLSPDMGVELDSGVE